MGFKRNNSDYWYCLFFLFLCVDVEQKVGFITFLKFFLGKTYRPEAWAPFPRFGKGAALGRADGTGKIRNFDDVFVFLWCKMRQTSIRSRF